MEGATALVLLLLLLAQLLLLLLVFVLQVYQSECHWPVHGAVL
jgi:hypothetical protein